MVRRKHNHTKNAKVTIRCIVKSAYIDFIIIFCIIKCPTQFLKIFLISYDKEEDLLRTI